MPEKSFKVNIYDVEITGNNIDEPGNHSFHQAIDNAIARPLDRRYTEVSGKGRRLENHQKEEDYYLLNFVTSQFDGPGRTEPETAAIPIDLAPEESFAHEAAMLYAPKANLAFVESTLIGMGAGAIARYFDAFANNNENYSLTPRFDDEAATRARRQQTIRSLIIRVALGPVTSSDHDAGIGVIKAFADDFDAGSIDIEIKAQREKGRTLSFRRVWQAIMPYLGSEDTHNITQLKLKGREHDDDPIEIIDLIQHREKRERQLQVDSQTRKVPHTDRWNALVEIYREFLDVS